jgi:hypothetical protein
MKEAHLIVETSSIKVRINGPATGNIWLELDSYYFPANGWNDFVVVVLGWWANALLRLIRGISTRETVHFMEGPYVVEVTLCPSGSFRFRALRDGGRNVEMGIGESPAFAFIVGLVSQGREVLGACKQADWWSKDAEGLEVALESLAKCRPENS